MSDPIAEFAARYWHMIVGFLTGLVWLIRLEAKVVAQERRQDQTEDSIAKGLAQIHDDIKDISKKVDESNTRANDLHIKLLERLSK